jgi:bacterioferritin (cytochrome b1)
VKGNQELIQKLDDLLADELTAVNQYIVHSEMCAKAPRKNNLSNYLRGRMV